jgi:hypothetical protein
LKSDEATIVTLPELNACNVVELRQYTLRPNQRDVLIELFDREFVETQEAVGMRVMGQFRDLDDPDRFVWLRGFDDMAARQRGLAAFYDGPVWAAHRDAANRTMVDSDNVLLLRPAWPGAGIGSPQGLRAAPGAQAIPAGRVEVTVFHLKQPATAELLMLCRDRTLRTTMLGWYITEPSSNTFPRLPVREGENVLVGFELVADASAPAFRDRGLRVTDVEAMLSQWLAKPPESLRLVPTARSALHA